jgi:hypothetical protein
MCFTTLNPTNPIDISSEGAEVNHIFLITRASWHVPSRTDVIRVRVTVEKAVSNHHVILKIKKIVMKWPEVLLENAVGRVTHFRVSMYSVDRMSAVTSS